MTGRRPEEGEGRQTAAKPARASPAEERAVGPASPLPSPPLESWEVLDLLTALVHKSLVVYEEDEQGRGRYRLLETVRQYSRDRLVETGEGEAVRERHGAFCLQPAEAAHAAAGQGKGAEAFERLEPEHDNLRGALAWSDGREAERALRLAGTLGEFWFDRGHWNEGREWLERALAGTPGAEPTAERARALAAAGRLATYQPDYSAARNPLEESIALYRALGDTRGLVEALTYLSELLWGREGRAVARVVQEEAVARARTLGDPRFFSMALCVLSQVIGDLQTSRMLLEESLALARQVGDRGLVSQSLQRLGHISSGQGDWARARELLEESVDLARAAKNKILLFWALVDLADVLSKQGDPERASSLREECLLLARELRTPSLVGVAIGLLVAHVPSYGEALQMVEQAAGEYGPEVVGGALGGLVARAPSYEEALQRIDQAVRDYGPGVAIHPLGGLGHAAREQGDYDWAATCYRRSLVLRQEVGDTLAIGQSLEDFAGLAARQQQWARAATLLGAAEGVCAEMGWTLPAAIPEEYERAVQGAREALGEAVFAAAWAEGRALSLPDAVAFALAAGEAV